MRNKLPLENREYIAAIIKERIYGSVTVLAVNIGLLLKDDLTVKHAFIAIISTVVGLWLAGLFASVLSHRVVHDENMSRKQFIKELGIHRGLLLAGTSSIIMFSLAAIGLIEIHTAIIIDISLAIVAITITIMRSAKTSSNSFVTALISIGIQAVIASAIILLKLGAK